MYHIPVLPKGIAHPVSPPSGAIPLPNPSADIRRRNKAGIPRSSKAWSMPTEQDAF